jgi:phage shock protein A
MEDIMSIFSRMLRLCKADLHGVMDQLEDKGLLLKQCLREMEESLKRKEVRLDQIARAGEQIRRTLARHNEELELAVGKEKDEISRMLIRKRRTLQSACRQLQRQLDTLAEEQGQVAGTLEKQRLQYDQLKAKAAAFCRQAEEPRLEDSMETMDGAFAWLTPSEEEVELELLQRKEVARKGGGS